MAVNAKSSTSWLLGAGDHIYSIVRFISLALVMVTAVRLDGQVFLPPTASSFTMVWWVYAIAAVALSLSALIPQIRSLTPWIFAIDLAFLTAIAATTTLPPTLFIALFMLPTVWAAIHRSSLKALISGVVAAGFYALATFLRRNPDGGNTELILGLALNGSSLILASWLASALADRSGEVNREQVMAARRDVEQAKREAEAYRDRMRSLYELAFKLSATMNFQTVLEMTVTESQRLINGTTSFVLLPTGEPDELYLAAGVGLGPDDQNRRVQIEPTGIIGQMLASGNARIVEKINESHALRSINAARICTSMCCVPLSAGRRNYGIVVVGSNRQTPLTADEMGMVSALANYAIIAMLNAQLVGELRDERTKLISKEEEVRQQLARDLHDGPAQSVAAITMNIEFVKRLLERDPARVQQELTKMGELARRTTYDIRTLLFELRPLSLDSQGLIATLREYATRFKDGPTEVVLEETIGEVRLDQKRESTVFNIIQEATNNAMKHAQAKHIWIRLTRQGDELMATVQDDGKGFDLAAVRKTYNQRGSFGLLNIDERARMVGGNAEMTSAPGAGTTVRVIVPLDATSI